MQYQIHYNKTGEERKQLVNALSEYLDVTPNYLGAPSFNFAVAQYVITKDGTVIIPENTDKSTIAAILQALKEKDFHAACITDENGNSVPELTMATALPKGTFSADTAANSAPQGLENVDDSQATDIADTSASAVSATPESAESDVLAVRIPLKGLNNEDIVRIERLINSKRSVLLKSLNTTCLPVLRDGDSLLFPWFTLQGLEGEAEAYETLVAAIVKYATSHRHIKSDELESSNDKYVMRMFLIRLGFNGPRHKTARQILLRNLTGNSSWASGKAPEKENSKFSQKETSGGEDFNA